MFQAFAYVAFVADVISQRIDAWNVAATLRVDATFQAGDMAAHDAGENLTGLTRHSDRGSNDMAMVHTDSIIELGAIPSREPSGNFMTMVELATLEWV